MARTLHSAGADSRIGQAGEDLSKIELWLRDQGVPQFMSRYSPRENLPLVAFVLLIVVAFDLAIEPWITLNAWFLLVLPTVLVCLVLIIKTVIIDQVSYLISGSLRPIRLMVLFLGVFLLAELVLRLNRDIYWSDHSVDFVVIVVLLWISAVLFRPDVWKENNEKSKKQRRLYFLLAVAVICFAFEGSLLPSSAVLMSGAMDSLMPAVTPVPQALAGLVVTVIIAVQTRSLISRRSNSGTVITQQFNVFFPAVPLLVLVFCAETTVLPYIGPEWFAAVVPLVIMASIILLSITSHRLQENRTRLHNIKWPKFLNVLAMSPGVILFVVLYLIACPIMVGTFYASEANESSVDSFGELTAGGSATLLAFGINLFYLGLVVIVGGFALDRITMWVIRDTFADWRNRISKLGQTLSILVVFATLLLLAPETWEIVTEASRVRYLMLLGVLLCLIGAFHLFCICAAIGEGIRFSPLVGRCFLGRPTPKLGP
jgi:hypothetical protein